MLKVELNPDYDGSEDAWGRWNVNEHPGRCPAWRACVVDRWGKGVYLIQHHAGHFLLHPSVPGGGYGAPDDAEGFVNALARDRDWTPPARKTLEQMVRLLLSAQAMLPCTSK